MKNKKKTTTFYFSFNYFRFAGDNKLKSRLRVQALWWDRSENKIRSKHSSSEYIRRNKHLLSTIFIMYRRKNIKIKHEHVKSKQHFPKMQEPITSWNMTRFKTEKIRTFKWKNIDTLIVIILVYFLYTDATHKI